MHEGALAGAVLAALREHPGGCDRLRVYVAHHPGTTPAELARIISAHLAGAEPPIPVPAVEVVPREQPRICAACAHVWPSAEPDPPCPVCGGAPLPPPHDHRIEVEFLTSDA